MDGATEWFIIFLQDGDGENDVSQTVTMTKEKSWNRDQKKSYDRTERVTYLVYCFIIGPLPQKK